MTTAQKIIKYVANAFAIFLIVTIISAIINGVFGIFGFIDNVNSKNNQILDEIITISDNLEEITTLKLDVIGTNLEIKDGEKFEVKTNNSNIKYSNQSGNVKIEEKGTKIWNYSKNSNSILSIYIPRDMKQISEIKMNMGAGMVTIENLNAENLSFDLGAGNVNIDNLTVNNKAKINGGAGNIDINYGKIANLNCDLGVGKTSIKADITGNSKIDTGIGELNLYLTLAKENYSLDVSKGIGEIKIGGSSVSDNTTIGNGKNNIKIDGGIGKIDIQFT